MEAAPLWVSPTQQQGWDTRSGSQGLLVKMAETPEAFYCDAWGEKNVSVISVLLEGGIYPAIFSSWEGICVRCQEPEQENLSFKVEMALQAKFTVKCLVDFFLSNFYVTYVSYLPNRLLTKKNC
jgi:hypothetical protein